MAKTKKLTQKSTVNGRQETLEDKYKSIAQLLGEDGKAKYGTLDLGEYETQLREMNLSDLNKYATEHYIKPVHNREITIKSLMSLFIKHRNNFVSSEFENKTQKIVRDKELDNILKDCR